MHSAEMFSKSNKINNLALLLQKGTSNLLHGVLQGVEAHLVICAPKHLQGDDSFIYMRLGDNHMVHMVGWGCSNLVPGPTHHCADKPGVRPTMPAPISASFPTA